MTLYSRGEVVLTEITFSGEPGRKRRPAVVLSVDAFTVDVESFANREAEGTLLVRKAGEYLYRLKN